MNIIKQITKRIRAFEARKFIKDVSNKRLLDIGCDDGFFINLFKNIQVDGTDLKYGQDAEQGFDYNNDTFDYITMLAVIEHFNDYKKVIFKCYRIVKDNGLLIITTPKKEAEWIINIYAKKECKDHKKYFIKKDFEDIQGFKLIHYSTFELGMNQLVVLRKQATLDMAGRAFL